MLETHTNTPAIQPLQTILHRVHMPLLIFAGVLFSLLLVITFSILPRFTKLHRGDGVAMSPHEIAQYEKQLSAQLVQQEENRVRLVLPINDKMYSELKLHKQTMTIIDLREQLMQAASRMGESEGVVSITALAIDGTDVTVQGDVHGVGTRSMTVLAAFVEQVGQLPFVANMQRPPFTREQSSDGSFHSPFTLKFSFASLAQ